MIDFVNDPAPLVKHGPMGHWFSDMLVCWNCGLDWEAHQEQGQQCSVVRADKPPGVSMRHLKHCKHGHLRSEYGNPCRKCKQVWYHENKDAQLLKRRRERAIAKAAGGEG